MRTSPSGPLSPIENPYPGVATFTSAATLFQGIHSLLIATSERNGQTIYARGGKILGLTISIFQAGTDSGVLHTWNVRKNGVLVPGMVLSMDDATVATATVGPSTVDGATISPTDLISLQMVPGTFVGDGAQFRSYLNIGV